MKDNIKVGNILIDSYHRLKIEQYAALSRLKNARFEVHPAKLQELEEIVYFPYDQMIEKIEREIFFLCNGMPVYKEFLITVNGLDIYDALELLVILKDITRFSTVSKLWKWAGFAPVTYCRKCSKTKEACRCNAPEYYNSNERRIRGVMPSYNERAKKLLIKIADKLMKTDGFYQDKFFDYRETEYNKNPELSDIHIQNRAKRKMIKLFLYHLYIKWYEAEGAVAPQPYGKLPQYKEGDE